MRILQIPALALLLLGSCQSQNNTKDDSTMDSTMNAADAQPVADNTLTQQETADGWVLLFDGKTKNGWHIYNNTTDGSAWKVDSGTLHLSPTKHKDWQTSGGGDLVSAEEYGNFELSLDWKIDTGGNSGILFYVNESPKNQYSYYTGPEMQVLDNERHPDAKIVKHRAGDLYDLITSSPETVKPANQWNHVDIISKDGKLELHLNGSKVVETTLWDDNWKKMVAGSKFKQWPDFGTFKSGKIALQDHGFNVWYKNIKLRKL